MVRLPSPGPTLHPFKYANAKPNLLRHTWTSWSASPPPNGADVGDNTRSEMSRGMLLMFKATLELLRWQNRQQKGTKPRFQFWLKTAVSVPISITVTTLLQTQMLLPMQLYARCEMAIV